MITFIFISASLLFTSNYCEDIDAYLSQNEFPDGSSSEYQVVVDNFVNQGVGGLPCLVDHIKDSTNIAQLQFLERCFNATAFLFFWPAVPYEQDEAIRAPVYYAPAADHLGFIMMIPEDPGSPHAHRTYDSLYKLPPKLHDMGPYYPAKTGRNYYLSDYDKAWLVKSAVAEWWDKRNTFLTEEYPAELLAPEAVENMDKTGKLQRLQRLVESRGYYALPQLIRAIRESSSPIPFLRVLNLAQQRQLLGHVPIQPYKKSYDAINEKFPKQSDRLKFINEWWSNKKTKFAALPELYTAIENQLRLSN